MDIPTEIMQTAGTLNGVGGSAKTGGQVRDDPAPVQAERPDVDADDEEAFNAIADKYGMNDDEDEQDDEPAPRRERPKPKAKKPEKKAKTDDDDDALAKMIAGEAFDDEDDEDIDLSEYEDDDEDEDDSEEDDDEELRAPAAKKQAPADREMVEQARQALIRRGWDEEDVNDMPPRMLFRKAFQAASPTDARAKEDTASERADFPEVLRQEMSDEAADGLAGYIEQVIDRERKAAKQYAETANTLFQQMAKIVIPVALNQARSQLIDEIPALKNDAVFRKARKAMSRLKADEYGGDFVSMLRDATVGAAGVEMAKDEASRARKSARKRLEGQMTAPGRKVGTSVGSGMDDPEDKILAGIEKRRGIGA